MHTERLINAPASVVATVTAVAGQIEVEVELWEARPEFTGMCFRVGQLVQVTGTRGTCLLVKAC